MKTISKMCFQGDVCFRRIAALPDDAVEQKADGRVVVAPSETGHHHAITSGEVKLFERAQRNPMICFLSIDGDYADVVHHRPHDTHETVRLLGGLWEVRRQREHTPEGWRRVED
jgi:hypothetical protein